MKTNYFVFFIIATFLLSSCAAGVNKDLMSGLKISNSGLSYKEAYLTKASVKLNSSEYSVGDSIVLIVNGVEGFTEKSGKVYLGASLDVFDLNGKKMMDNPDLFSSYDAEGLAKEQAEVITLTLIVGSPLVAGTKYTWKSKVWDKNGKGEINSEVEFTVK